MTSQSNLPSPACRLAAAIGICLAFAFSSHGAEPISELHEVRGVSLLNCKQGASCVMLFGEVGEAFECWINGDSGKTLSRISTGQGAGGEQSLLPKGIELDLKRGCLTGVPEQSGFHEFVVLVTEKGVTRELVYLIDIQDSRTSPMLDSYASTFSAVSR